MTAVERIQAAIDKLTAERDAATPGPWKRYESIQADTFIIGPRGFLYDEIIAGPTYERANVDLIITLHRTIDAQLSILEYAHNQWRFVTDPKGWDSSIPAASYGEQWEWDYSRTIALADAILGADS